MQATLLRLAVRCVCAGGELFEHIGKRAAFTEAAVAEIARSLLQYLAHIHGLGVAHMDIKPENIMFDSQGTDGVLKVGVEGCLGFC
jgi:calcium-dependent protein kinase